jgi:SAM-dependent methyltransferase
VSAATPGREISERHVSELDELGLGYWWFAVRRGHLEAIFREAAQLGDVRYLDLGCGPGRITAHLIRTFRPARALGLDGTRDAVAIAAASGVPVRYADLRRPFALEFAPNLVTALDVLEHLDDPVGTLANLAEAAAPGARLAVTVPALPSLWSRWDEVADHRRRYTRGELAAHLGAGGWEPRRVRYIFSYCVPGAWVERKLLRRVGEFEFPRVSPLANAALTAAGHLERRLGSPFPFGTSLLATAERRRA